jgi:hypothetical protein
MTKRILIQTHAMLLLASAVAPVALLLNACSKPYNYSLDARSFTPAVLQDLESKTGLTFPEGSKGLNMYYRGSYEPCLRAKLKIAPQGQAAILQQIRDIEHRRGIIGASGSLARLPWWTPSRGVTLVERHFDTTNDCLVHLILSSEEKNCILYIEWFTN